MLSLFVLVIPHESQGISPIPWPHLHPDWFTAQAVPKSFQELLLTVALAHPPMKVETSTFKPRHTVFFLPPSGIVFHV